MRYKVNIDLGIAWVGELFNEEKVLVLHDEINIKLVAQKSEHIFKKFLSMYKCLPCACLMPAEDKEGIRFLRVGGGFETTDRYPVPLLSNLSIYTLSLGKFNFNGS